MSKYDWILYSQGTYWLFEHWQEDGRNIYSKAKYDSKEQFLLGAGKLLSAEQVDLLSQSECISLKQDDGTTYFYKYVNLA